MIQATEKSSSTGSSQAAGSQGEPVSIVNGNLVLDETMLKELSPHEIIGKIIKFLQEYKGSMNDSLVKLLDIANEMGIENLQDQIKQAEQAEKSGRLGKVMKGLGIFMAVFSVVLAVIIPTPLTIGLAIFSVGMLADQTISAALGQESLMSRGLSKITEGLMTVANAIVDRLVEAGIISEDKAQGFKYAFAAAVAIVVVAVVIVASKGAGAMVSKMLASVGQGAAKGATSAAAAVTTNTARGGMQSVGNFINANKERLMDVATKFQAAGALAESGVGVANGVVQIKYGQITFEIDVRTGELALIDSQTNLLVQDFNLVGDRMNSLLQQSSQLLHA
jgi:hypothetical protein